MLLGVVMIAFILLMLLLAHQANYHYYDCCGSYGENDKQVNPEAGQRLWGLGCWRPEGSRDFFQAQ